MGANSSRQKFHDIYGKIADNYTSLVQVTWALRHVGLESSNLIVGIDFTKSNEWTGEKSFNGKNLHHIGRVMNPYEHAISIIGKTLASFDDDNLIPCYGFGDATTHDTGVFSFYPDEKPCNGFEEVLSRYREIAPNVRLAGPTSFAPMIETAIAIVDQSGGQYHVLLMIVDGQVSTNVDTKHGRLSPQEKKTIDAIVAASKYPLSIVLVGVGDGPWDKIEEFDDNIPARNFDNVQFVNLTNIMAKDTHHAQKETEFALAALMEIPFQYKATMELGLLGNIRGTKRRIEPLPPPVYNVRSSSKPSFVKSAPPTPTRNESDQFPFFDLFDDQTKVSTDPPEPKFARPSTSTSFRSTQVTDPPPPASPIHADQLCIVCHINKKNMAFGCGHQTCTGCGNDLEKCPTCGSRILLKLQLF